MSETMTTVIDGGESTELLLDGQWCEPRGTGRIDVTSPNDGSRLGSVPEGTVDDVDAAVAAARRAFDLPGGWSQWTGDERAEALERLSVAFERRAERIATLVSAQNGMPISVARQVEGGLPVMQLRYYAQLAREELEDRRPAAFGGSTVVRRVPVGVVGAIVPWNVPQALAFGKIAPALAAGCTVVLKPSPETVLDSVELGHAIVEAGLPAGVLNIVPGGRDIGAHLVAHPDVDKITFTGSTAAGRTIATVCGNLLRPVTLELGGKSAAVVLDDVDLDSVLPALFTATMFNNGQACYACTRVLLPRSRYAAMVEQIGQFVAERTVGHSLDPATEVGPLVSARQRERVESYIAQGVADGARLITGGGRPDDTPGGWFVEPTVFADVDNASVIAQEEIFGPVLSLIPYDTVDEAVSLANASEFGLGGTVWTADPARGMGVATRIRTGTFGINGYLPDLAAPFGGMKASGLGRECGPEGMASYQELQSIYT